MEEMITRMQCEWDVAVDAMRTSNIMEGLKNDNEVLKERYDALLESFHHLQDDYEARGRTIDHLRRVNYDKVNACFEKEVENAELTNQVNNLKKANTELTKHVDYLKIENGKANEKIDELNKDRARLMGWIATLELEKQGLSDALVKRQGVTDTSVEPFLRRLQEAFNKSVLWREDVRDRFDAYAALSNLSNVFREIYCMMDIRLPEEAIFETIYKFLHKATENYVENFALRKEQNTEEGESNATGN